MKSSLRGAAARRRGWSPVGRATLLSAAALSAVAAVPSVGATAEYSMAGSVPATGENISFQSAGIASAYRGFAFAPQMFPAAFEHAALGVAVDVSSGPRAIASAGLFQAPLAMSLGLIVGREVPLISQIMPVEIPESAQNAWKSVEWDNLPSGCTARFPPVRDGGDEAYCGGPAAGGRPEGVEIRAVNGHAVTAGSIETPLTTSGQATTDGVTVELPAVRGAMELVHTDSEGRFDPQIRRAVASSTLGIGRLTLLDGVVEVNGIRSQSFTAKGGDAENHEALTELVIGEMTVAGIATRIDSEGVTAAKTESGALPADALNKAVQEALKESGLRLRLVPAPPPLARQDSVQVESAYLEVEYRDEGREYVARFGQTAARAEMTDFGSVGEPEERESSPPASGSGSGVPAEPEAATPIGPPPPASAPVSDDGSQFAGYVTQATANSGQSEYQARPTSDPYRGAATFEGAPAPLAAPVAAPVPAPGPAPAVTPTGGADRGAMVAPQPVVAFAGRTGGAVKNVFLAFAGVLLLLALVTSLVPKIGGQHGPDRR